MSKLAYAWISASESVLTEKGHWNIEKASKYDQDKAKVISYMTECFNEDDQGLIDEHGTAKAVWDHLHSRRKLIAADSSLSKAYPDKILFFILLLKIPEKYTVVIAGFRTKTRTDLSIEDKIQIFKFKEEDDREEAHAAAKFRRHRPRPRQDSDISMRDPPIECYECASENHILRDCPYLKRARIYARKLREADQRRLLRSSNSKQGDAACGESDPEADETSISELDAGSDAESDEQYQEAVHLSKELISKSSPELCRTGMEGIFNDTSIKIVHNKIPMIIAEQKDGLYVVKNVAKELRQKALFTLAEKDDVQVADLDSDPNPDSSEEEDLTTKAERHYYKIIHRRFAHCGLETLHKLHKVTTLTKMRNKVSKTLAKHKTEALALVHIDVAGPLPKSLRGNKYFLQIVYNYTKKVWSFPIKTKDESPLCLQSWRNKVELQFGKKLKAIRSDNAPELKKTIDEWERAFGI
ncbi:hypothetical protein K3495_g5287 [Podosphaera aphanis]|nr:hypothetical protein K3495_g5287 [Podosphaera aphanis]